MILLLLACAAPPAADSGPTTDLLRAADDTHLVPLDAPRLLRRMSLDLRGVLPSTAELDAVEADPAAITTLREQYLADPLFEERLVRLLNERWLTRIDEFVLYYTEYPDLGREPRNEYPFERAVGEEPLRLMARVAAEDLPWPTIVTADWSMATEITASEWPVTWTTGDTGWHEVHYTDGRPAAGVLSTNGLWWRYYSTPSNLNRGRAAALSRALLCEDYLTRPISLASGAPLLDAAGIESALHSNPYCMGCHSSLDPIASTLFGFWVANLFNGDEAERYHPEREPLGLTTLGETPEWFGQPVSGLAELGARIGADPRFARCAATSMAELFWRRSTTPEDFDRIEALRQAYLDGGERLKPLIVAATDDPVYRAGGLTDAATDTELADEATVRLMDATLLESVLADLVGFEWSSGGFEVLDNDTYGYRVMGGGVDGEQVTRPQRTPSLTWMLTLERAAEGAGSDAVVQIGVPGTLLADVNGATTPTDPAFAAELDALHWRLYGIRADDAWATAMTTLWSDVAATDGSLEAWRAVFVAMLRDPLMAGY